MQSNLKARKTYAVSLSYVGEQDNILRPELLALKLKHRVNPLDIGVCAYSIREKINRGYRIDPDSVVPSRRKFLVALMERYSLQGGSHRTIETNFKYIEMALDWCDLNACSEVLCNPESARTAYMGYSNHIFQKILVEGMAPLTGQLCQGALRRALELQFPQESGYIITAVPPVQHSREGLAPPEERDVARYVDVSLSIAITFSKFLIEELPFPLKFESERYQTYIFPGKGKFITPYTQGHHEFKAYHYHEGRIKDAGELMREWPDMRKGDIYETIKRAHRVLDEANRNPYHQFRIWLASLTMRAYACLINLVVGANSSELVQFLYDDAVELVKSPLKKELSAVKLRAKGLEVAYTIGRGPGMEILREYLRFREWLLDGRESEYLFFQVETKGELLDAPDPLSKSFSSQFFTRIKGVFVSNETKNIPPVLVRKYKSLILHQLRHSPMLVSAVLNHSVGTNNRYYSGITLGDQKAEFGNYWAAVKKAAERIKNSASTSGVSIAVGHCESMDSPEKDIPVVAIEPDCKTQYGCLFCIHYVVHSDELDIHKLVSFLYVIDIVRNNAPNFEFSEEVFKDVVIRIDVILEAISQRSIEAENMVVAMKNRVFSLGILTAFWERRLQRYEKMGIYF
ncbi:hypothetical protein C7A11_25085 [Pseudomonas simiae]|uniref:hypothetical protein n=1 Tax=Pseudomonas simiae TaxID=321846 RepID=UPI000D03796C|nr:hypothetical protein [Pseudomonas simiae]PRW84825.1 hypothetical protein C7A11_25085 [Pseudomonas simiae]